MWSQDWCNVSYFIYQDVQDIVRVESKYNISNRKYLCYKNCNPILKFIKQETHMAMSTLHHRLMTHRCLNKTYTYGDVCITSSISNPPMPKQNMYGMYGIFLTERSPSHLMHFLLQQLNFQWMFLLGCSLL